MQKTCRPWVAGAHAGPQQTQPRGLFGRAGAWCKPKLGWDAIIVVQESCIAVWHMVWCPWMLLAWAGLTYGLGAMAVHAARCRAPNAPTAPPPVAALHWWRQRMVPRSSLLQGADQALGQLRRSHGGHPVLGNGVEGGCGVLAAVRDDAISATCRYRVERGTGRSSSGRGSGRRAWRASVRPA